MNKFDYKNLTPFKWFVLENFPFIEADFGALTEWQLFCKIGKEINKIIDSQNIVGEQAENLTNAFNNLKNYVDNYFNNLDEEIGRVNTVINLLEEEITKVEKYSTEEVKIGTWIDGKPLYRKIIKFIGDITNETSIKHNIDNFGTLINYGGSINFFNREHPFPVIYPSDMVKFGGGVYSVSDTTITVEIGTEIIKNANPSNLIIILEYTKTTD